MDCWIANRTDNLDRQEANSFLLAQFVLDGQRVIDQLMHHVELCSPRGQRVYNKGVIGIHVGAKVIEKYRFAFIATRSQVLCP